MLQRLSTVSPSSHAQDAAEPRAPDTSADKKAEKRKTKKPRPPPIECTVRRSKVNAAGNLLMLTYEPSAPMPFAAGQFIRVHIDRPGDKPKCKRYSVATPPEATLPKLCVRLVGGLGSSYLQGLAPSDKLQISGPYGHFVYAPTAERRVCFIATGTGVAPLRSMMLSEAYKACPPMAASFLVGARDEGDLPSMGWLDRVPGGVTMVKALSRAAPEYQGQRGRVTDYLRQLDETFPWGTTDFYLCGNGDMIREVEAILAARGVAPEAIHSEAFFKRKKSQDATAPAGA